MRTRSLSYMAVVLLLGVPAGWAGHLPDLTTDEEKCERAAAGILSKFSQAKIKCLVKCDQGAVKGSNPATDCTPPFAGATLTCINAAESKAKADIPKKCAKDCPECYAGGDCTAFGNTQVDIVETLIDAQTAIVGCDDPDLSTEEIACRQGFSKAGSKYSAAVGKCYVKCGQSEATGKIPLGSCDPPNPSDGKTADCLASAASKYLDTCGGVCADAPDCTPAFPDCAAQQGVIKGLVEGFNPVIGCDF
jgi:hypothetical protein